MDLIDLRAKLDRSSAKLLDECGDVLGEAGLLDMLLEQLPTITAGLEPLTTTGSDDQPITVCTLSLGAELLLREYLATAVRPHRTLADRRAYMLRVAQLAGYA